MASTLYVNQPSSPMVTSSTSMPTEEIANSPPLNTNRRGGLGNRLRNLFRRNSPSPNRTTSSERRPPSSTISLREASSSPTSAKSSTEAPHLRAPSVNWTFGKKKTKSLATGSTPTTSKKKIKANRKNNGSSTPPLEISSPIYQQEIQSSIQGQNFTPRTPELVHGSTNRSQPSSTYESTTKGFRDYAVIDQTQSYQQVTVPNVDVFTPSTYTFDHSYSSSMNRQQLTNTTSDQYHSYHDNTISTGSIPLADIEVIPTPQRKRKVGDTPPLSTTKILAEKPPIIPQASSRASSTMQSSHNLTNPTQWKNTSSSTLNNTSGHATISPSMDVDAPKLNTPSISFGSSSNKKKAKRTKSQTRTDGITSSSSTINVLAQQIPTKPNRSWNTTYGSLPDAEIMYAGSLTSLRSSKSNITKYPGISAIVQYHLRPPGSVYHHEYSPATTRPTTKIPISSPAASPHRTQRFDTSTTTLNEYEENSSWSHRPNIESVPSPSSIHHHDGFIRPMTPENPPIQPDVSIIRIGIEAIRGRSPPPRPPRYDSPSPPTTYRSSATIYTKDKHRYVNGGEIRTWSSYENNINNNGNQNDLYKKPTYTHVEVDYKREQQSNDYDYQIVPPKIKNDYEEYRYSPRAHEQELYKKEQTMIHDQEIQEEERYEISYELERKHQHYAYQTHTHYDELHTTNRYTNDIDDNGDDRNVNYSKLSSATRSDVINERDRIYDQVPRSYTDNGRMQESFEKITVEEKSKEIPHTYKLKRSDSYDGLGISISADTNTRSNHIIRDVEQGSPAHHAGLRPNDRIISINDINVENVDFSNVLILIKQGLDNDNLQLSVIHELE